MASVPLGLVYLLLICEGVTSSLYFCSSTDPCVDANQTSLFEPYARYEVCQYDQSYNLCDRYIDPKWYRVDDPMLDHCPQLGSCGALYPLWLNGTLPLQSEGIVTRNVCKVGFNDCCVKQYNIQIKNCSAYHVYCLGALDSCADRYCFGVNGSCDVPTTTQTTEVTVTSPKPTTPVCSQGKNGSCKRKTEKTKTKEQEKLTKLEILLIAVLATMILLFISLLVYWKCSNTSAVGGKMVSPQKSNSQCRNKSPPPSYDTVIKMKENSWVKY